MAQNSQGNFGARLLIALYAAGIVALGLVPLRKHFGDAEGFFAYIKKKTAVFAVAPEELRDSPGVVEKKVEIADKPEVLSKKKPGARKDLDQLRANDRKELNDLVDSLN